jgi:hypothetical protein
VFAVIKKQCNAFVMQEKYKYFRRFVMSNKLFTVIFFVLLTALAGSASAVDLFWLNTSGDGLWKTPANWTGGTLPTIVDKTKINLLPGPLIDANTAAVANHVAVGDGGTGALLMTGGTLTVGTAMGDTWLILAYGASDVGTFTMEGGTVTTADRVFVGFQGNGTLDMNGGTFKIGGKFGIGNNDAGGTAARGYVNLNGGTIDVNGAFDISSPTGCLGKLDITGGKLVLNGYQSVLVRAYITAGYIVAYNGLGDVIVEFNSVDEKTIVTGRTNPYKARFPYPTNNTSDAPPYVVLSWTSGDNAATHNVYFGTDANSVRDANTSTVGIYKGSQPRDETSYEPTGLELGKRYYWRIDEVNEPNVYKGDLWQFAVANYALVDDFEKYADTNALLVSWSNAGTGATLSLATTGGHDKAKTMKFDYNNSGAPLYSEAQTDDIDYDWTIAGVVAIDIWYKGNASNAAEKMYAALEDNNSHPVAVVANSDPNIVKSSDWQVWRIKLTDFAGVNLTNVKKFYIGFGDRNNPAAGGTGTVYFDDIRLHPSRCLDKPLEDLNDDCVVDFKDFAIMAKDWLNSSEM